MLGYFVFFRDTMMYIIIKYMLLNCFHPMVAPLTPEQCTQPITYYAF